jgi:hypothetical protein
MMNDVPILRTAAKFGVICVCYPSLSVPRWELDPVIGYVMCRLSWFLLFMVLAANAGDFC